jgi:threonine/homoserine/homoserine lactone efflux protein
MADLLPPWPLFAAFVAASLVLAVTPGPGVLYIVTRSLSQGKRSGLISVAGVALGSLCNAIAAAIGLAALLAVSSAAFLVVKYAGAAYLVYLGIRALRDRAPNPGSALAASRPSTIFRDGFIVALLNPKTTLFFAAFLPQFIVTGTGSGLQTVILGAVFVVIAAMTDTGYVLAAGALARMRTRRSRDGDGAVGQTDRELSAGPAFRWITGSTYIGLGMIAALAGSWESKKS